MVGSVARPRSRQASIAGLLLALGAPFLLPLLPGQAHQRITDVGQDTLIMVFEWIVALAIMTIVVFWERLPLRSIGFRRPSWRDFAALGVALAVMALALGILGGLTHPSGPGADAATAARLAAVPLAVRVGLFLTAGFCEELLLRGYAIERLTLFTGNLWSSGLATAVIFTLAHVPRYGFSLPLASVAIIATCISALYLWTRNFWICALMHALIDCVGLVVAPAFATH